MARSTSRPSTRARRMAGPDCSRSAPGSPLVAEGAKGIIAAALVVSRVGGSIPRDPVARPVAAGGVAAMPDQGDPVRVHRQGPVDELVPVHVRGHDAGPQGRRGAPGAPPPAGDGPTPP